MPMTQERLEYQREYRKRTGYASAKKYAVSDKGKKTIKRAVVSLKKRINSDFDAFVAYSVRTVTYQQGCPNKASIDRINNRYGYSLKNIQVVCQQVNYARNDMSTEEFEQMCIDVANNIKMRQ